MCIADLKLKISEYSFLNFKLYIKNNRSIPISMEKINNNKCNAEEDICMYIITVPNPK